MKKILITGGNGFLGRNFKDYCELNNIEATFITRSEANLENLSQTYTCISYHKPNVVIHLAGYVGGIKENKYNQYEMLRRNSIINLNIVEACSAFDVETFIGTLSTCIYPYHAHILPNLSEPVQEYDINLGFEETNYSYALAKSILYTQTMNVRQTGLDYKCIIPTNLYGPHDYTEESGHKHMISSVINKLMKAKKNDISELNFWGTGHETRQYLYAPDLVDIVFKLINCNFDCVNILEKNSLYMTRDVIMLIAKHMDMDVHISFSGEFAGIRTKYVDNAKLIDLIGPYQFISLNDGIKKTIEFIREKNS